MNSTTIYDRSLSTLQRHMTMDRFNFLLDLEKSHGSWLVTVQGKELLDCYTAFASLPIGWNHPRINEPAFIQRLGRAAVNKPALSDTFTPELAEFVETFYRVGIPADMPRVFFIDGGALAVENSLKAAFDWKVQKNKAAGKGERGSKIIHFARCFHGRTGYTMSLTDSSDPRKTRWFPKFDWPRIEPPALRFPTDLAAIAEVVEKETRAIRAIEAAFEDNPDDVAAILIEPIQCEGGDNHFRPEFLQALQKQAHDNDALFILDEVQTGVGMTGSFWCFQQLGLQPDLVCFGKKSQVCGLFAGGRIDEVERNVFVEPSRINSTFGGNLVDMVRFQRVLEVIEDDDLVGNAERVGRFFLSQLEQMAADRPDLLSNPRGRGLILAIDLPDAATRDAVVAAAIEVGLFVLTCGDRSLRFRPNLAFTEELAGEAITRLRKAVALVADGRA
ncbi:MAG: L-lysine 6-transaminase [Myxococcota bacterium]|nr:L-lysine 6-transaminase [Myxococcota bacterium]